MSTASTQLQVSTSYRQIFKLALPIMAAVAVPQINFVTNNIFLGGTGEQSLAVAGITGVYYLIFAVIGLGLNNGLQALIARRAGENRVSEIGVLFQQGLRIAMVLAAVGIALTYLLAPVVLRWSLHNESNVTMAVNFLYIRIWGLPFLFIYQMRNALLVGTNQSRFLVIGTLAETVTNIVLDYGLIYGKLGMPEMGFNGAALASVIAEATGLIVIFLVMRKQGISRALQLFRNSGYHKENTRLILSQSSPLILQYVLSIVAWEFFYILIEHHGEQELAISNAMRNIFGLFGCATWAFSAATNAMVSNVIGQGLTDKVMELIWKIVRLSAGFALLVCLVLNLAPGFFLQVYQQGPDFIAAATPVARVVSIGLVLQSIANIWLNAVVGTGNSRFNLFSESLAIVVYVIYVYLVLEYFHLSITWGWLSECLYWCTIFTPSFWYMMSGRWKHKKI
ncbi:MATE family efflux transporter [Filimonas effusa]|uniref:Multidrug-efflux transporter n=1 Tax=Filimonas effusa TaxID=2508721 RepID=A0A4Q1DCD0_9BACT|nr:MATE family efflux transporter [Filimonas effusa]RXK86273.1 MATE family efflux transporter [Filimonas effusa]